MDKQYAEPAMEIIALATEDVVRTSGDDLPDTIIPG